RRKRDAEPRREPVQAGEAGRGHPGRGAQAGEPARVAEAPCRRAARGLTRWMQRPATKRWSAPAAWRREGRATPRRSCSARPARFDTGAMLAPAKATAVGGQAISILSAQKMEEQGKLAAALEAYVQLKRFAEAGRVAKALGRTADAAQLFADAGAPLEAAQAYLESG